MKDSKEYPRYMSNFDEELHGKLASDVRAEMARNKIYIRHIADELGKSKTTINLWLLKNVTHERYDVLIGAIKRIVEKRNNA